MKNIKEIFISELNKEENKELLSKTKQILGLKIRIQELEEEAEKMKALQQELIGHIIVGHNITALGLEEENIRIAFTPENFINKGIDYEKVFENQEVEIISKYKKIETLEKSVWDDEKIKEDFKDKICYKMIKRPNQIKITPLKGGEK